MTTDEPIRTSTYIDLAHQVLTELQLEVIQGRLAGHTWETIGLAMNIDESTVRGHHRRAIARLRKAQRREAA